MLLAEFQLPFSILYVSDAPYLTLLLTFAILFRVGAWTLSLYSLDVGRGCCRLCLDRQIIPEGFDLPVSHYSSSNRRVFDWLLFAA